MPERIPVRETLTLEGVVYGPTTEVPLEERLSHRHPTTGGLQT